MLLFLVSVTAKIRRNVFHEKYSTPTVYYGHPEHHNMPIHICYLHTHLKQIQQYAKNKVINIFNH